MKKIYFLVLLAISFQISSQVPSYVPTDGLVGYWPFNNNANDVSGNNNNGTVSQVSWGTDRFGNTNSTAEFNGDYHRSIRVQNPNVVVGNQFTFSFWLKVNTPLSYYNSIIDASGRYCQLYGPYPSYITSGLVGKLGFCGYLGNNNSNISLNDGNWHQGVMVADWSAGTVKIYIDGILNVTRSYAPQSTSQFEWIDFGQNYNTINDPIQGPQGIFAGELDDICIWNRALTDTEITGLYNGLNYSDTCNAVSGPLTQGLIGYWPFCGNANDDSGHGNNGTVNGATLTSDRFGNPNSAYNFNGISDFIQTSNTSILPTGNASRSVSYWMKSSSSQINMTVFGYGDNNANQKDFHVWHNWVCNGVNINISNAARTFTTGNLDDNWNHYVVVFDNTQGASVSNVKIYKNGALLSNTCTDYGSGNLNTGNLYPLTFGKYHATNQYYFNGTLDDIGMWNRALTTAEVTQLYNQNQCFTNTTVTDTLVINVGQLSYTNPVAYANNITIYPNPTSTQVNINFNNITDLTGGNINIINSLGQQVASTPITVSGTQTSMQLATWGGAGMYFIQIINSQGQIVDIKKIILQ